MSSRYICIFFWLFTALFAGPSSGYAQEETAGTPERYVDVRLVPEKTQIEAGDSFYIAIEETIHPGWHTYWLNPGDSGEATTIEWDLPDGFEATTLTFPLPEAIPVPPLTNYGYKDRVVLLQEIYAPYDLPEGPFTFNAEVSLLVCEEICIPEFSSHSITFNDGSQQSNDALIDEALKKTPIKTDWAGLFREENDELVVSIEPKFPATLKTINLDSLALMPVQWGLVNYSAPLNGYLKEPFLVLQKERGDRDLRALEQIDVLVTYTDINGNFTGIEVEALPDPEWTKTLMAPSTEQKPFSGTEPLTTIPDTSFMTALLFALLGGLILNLMPCVFPVLSMKALSLCEIRGKELKKARLHGIAYTAGILASFGVIAGILMALKAAGEAIGWGFQLQNPMMVLTLSWLFFLIGLSLAGFFSLTVFIGSAGNKIMAQHGYAGSFLTGVLAAIVATPCTAPFMGVAMGYALTQPPVAGMVVFLMLGTGLALPYLALSFFPFLQKILPRPGHWMETFKHILAVPMFASAVWLVWVYNQQTDMWSIPVALGGMAALTLAVWALKTSQKQKQGNNMAVIFAIVLGITTFKAGDIYSKQGLLETNKQEQNIEAPFNTASLETLLTESDVPVFTNMTAAWCITCKINEKLVLKRPETKELFKKHEVHYMKGDWTNQNPEITAYLEQFGRNGVPLYVFYGARNEETGKRPAPVILPQILTPALVEQTITTPKGDK